MGDLILPPSVGGVSSRSPIKGAEHVPDEVKQWGALVSWLRRKGLNPLQVRDVFEQYEQNKGEDDGDNNDDKGKEDEGKNCSGSKGTEVLRDEEKETGENTAQD